MNETRTISSASRMSLMLVVVSFLLSFVPSPGNAGYQPRTFKATQTEEVVWPRKNHKANFAYGLLKSRSYYYTPAVDATPLIEFHTRKASRIISASRGHTISFSGHYYIVQHTNPEDPSAVS